MPKDRKVEFKLKIFTTDNEIQQTCSFSVVSS